MHVGARARHLTTHAIDICLVLEDALQTGLERISDFMVTDLVSVEHWQPVSWARQRMLESSFTYLPIRPDNERDLAAWRMVGDWQLAVFLADPELRAELLSCKIDEAISKGLNTSPIVSVDASTKVAEIRTDLGPAPLLVVSDGRVIGLVTAFDVL
jgi:CBS-domain-containing membrane protein